MVGKECRDVARNVSYYYRIVSRGDVASFLHFEKIDGVHTVSTNHHANLQHFSQYNRKFCPIPPDCG